MNTCYKSCYVAFISKTVRTVKTKTVDIVLGDPTLQTFNNILTYLGQKEIVILKYAVLDRF